MQDIIFVSVLNIEFAAFNQKTIDKFNDDDILIFAEYRQFISRVSQMVTSNDPVKTHQTPEIVQPLAALGG